MFGKSGALRPATLLKRDSNKGEICEVLKNTYFEKHLETTASMVSRAIMRSKI